MDFRSDLHSLIGDDDAEASSNNSSQTFLSEMLNSQEDIHEPKLKYQRLNVSSLNLLLASNENDYVCALLATRKYIVDLFLLFNE